MEGEISYPANYIIRVTKNARKQGLKVGLSDKARLEIIRDLKELRFWPNNYDFFDVGNAFGALEFRYQKDNKWIRVFAFQDDERKIMWIIRVIAKKQNTLNNLVDKIGIETAVREILTDIRNFKKELSKANKRRKFALVSGEKHD